MFTHPAIRPCLIVAVIGLPPLAAQAADEWTTTLGAQAVAGAYNGADQRDRLSVYGLSLSADYLERAGFSLGLTHSGVKGKNGAADIKQNAAFASSRMHMTPDGLQGRLSLRLDLHAIDNDDATGNTDSVYALAPQVSYLSYDKQRYYDLGYARSIYKNSLSLNQFTPTLGIGFNDGADWLQFRAWFIKSSNAARSQGKTSTSALETKWTHWLGSNPAGIDNIKAGLVVGERIYTVDGDAGSVANLSDIHRGGFNLGAEWKLGKDAALLAMIGRDRFRNADLTPADDYSLNYIYLWLSGQW